MIAELMTALLLVALAAFILWESWQRRKSAHKPISRAMLERGFVPGATAGETALFVFAGAVLFIAISRLLDPRHPPFSGRGAVLDTAMYAVAGPLGMPVAAFIVATVLFFLGFSRRHRRKAGQRSS